jgi:protein-tyrosine phosphatase
MIDMHTHVLPIDNGAKNFDEAVEMCRVASKNGIRKIVCTPHVFAEGYHNDIDKILENMKKLQGLLKKEKIDIKLIQGAENDLASTVTINKTKYLLVDLEFTDVPVYAEDRIRELLRDFYVIIAHPERNRKIQEKPEIAVKFVELGCYVQINAASVLAKDERRKVVEFLIKNNAVHFIATDMHNVDGAASLINAVEEAKKLSDRAMDFVTTNPEKVIAGQKI